MSGALFPSFRLAAKIYMHPRHQLLWSTLPPGGVGFKLWVRVWLPPEHWFGGRLKYRLPPVQTAARVQGVAGVLTAQDACLAHGLAEPTAALLAAVQRR